VISLISLISLAAGSHTSINAGSPLSLRQFPSNITAGHGDSRIRARLARFSESESSLLWPALMFSSPLCCRVTCAAACRRACMWIRRPAR